MSMIERFGGGEFAETPGSALVAGVMMQLERERQTSELLRVKAATLRDGLEAIRDSTTPHADELRDQAFEVLRDAA